MARVFLTDETYNAASDDAVINGSAGTEQVNVFAGVTGLDVTSSVERVDLPGDIADFTFSSFGNSVTILDGNGDIVAQISGADGKQLVFGDGSVDVAFDAGTGDLTVGGETVGSTAGPVTPAASEIDAGTTSETADGTPIGGGDGQTFTLTTDTDISGSLEGSEGTTDTSGDDTYEATDATLDAGDIISDSSGTDVMNVAATADTAAATIIGVETINVDFTTFAAPTVDAANIVGGTINVSQSQVGGSADATVDNLGVTTNVALGAGITGTATIVAEEGTSNSVTLDRGDAGTVNIDLDGTAGTDAATISTTGTVALETGANGQVENLSLSGNGDAVTFNIDAGDAPEAVTLTGDQDVTVGIDAADISGETVTDSTTAGTTTLAIETATAATHDLSDATVDVVDLTDNTNGGYTFSVQNEQAVTLSADMTANGNLTIDSTDLDDQTADETVNLTVTTSQGPAGGAGDVILTDFEVVNLIVDDGDAENTATISIEDFTAANATVNASGSENLTFVENGGVAISELDATNLSGVLTVTADANVDNVTGGSANDVITATQGTTVTVDGGAGTANQLIISDDGGATDADASDVTFSNFQLVTLNDDFTDFTVSQLSGQSFAVNGDAAGNAIEIDETDSVDSLMIDLSALVIDTATVDEIIVDGTQISGDFGDNAAQTFIGNDTDDTYTGNDGDDSFTGGEGADEVTAGAGDDTIDLTEDTSAVDTVNYTTGTDGTDTITGFESGSDEYVTDFASSASNTAGDASVVTAAADTGSALTIDEETDDVFQFTGVTAGADMTDEQTVIDAISDGTINLDGNSSDDLFFLSLVTDQGTYLYEVTEDGGANDVLTTADTIDLVGIFDDSAQLATGDIQV